MRAVIAGTVMVAALFCVGCAQSTSPSDDFGVSRQGSEWQKLRDAANRDRKASGVTSKTVTKAFAVLRSSPEVVPSAEAAHAMAVLDAPPGALDFMRAQHIAGPPTGGLWIVSGGNLLCIMKENRGSATCDTAVNVLRKGLLISVITEAHDAEGEEVFEVVGIAPDRVRFVQVEVAGRRTRDVPVRGNAYALRGSEIIVPKKFVR